MMKMTQSLVASRWICVLLVCFIDGCSTLLNPPTISDDIYTYEGNIRNPSIDIECRRPFGGWGNANFVQIFKSEIYFPSVNGQRVTHGATPGDDGIYRFMVATNGNLEENFRPLANRYSLTYSSTSSTRLKLTIQNPVAEDSGIFKCRTTLVSSNLVNIESAESTGTANVTILERPFGMFVFTADPTRTYFGSTIMAVTGPVTLNNDSPTRFGCSAQYNTGLPTLTAYWGRGFLGRYPTDVDWQYQDGVGSSTNVSPTSVTKNASVLLWATVGTGSDTDIPNIGARNGQTFICEATFNGISQNVLRQFVQVEVRSSTPTIPPTTTTTTTTTTSRTTTTGTTTTTPVDDPSNFAPDQVPRVWAVIIPLLLVKMLALCGF